MVHITPPAPLAQGDFWSRRYTSAIPWEREDVSQYDGGLFQAAVQEKAVHPEITAVPKRCQYPPLRHTYLADATMNPGLNAVGLDGMYYDYDKDDYYTWRYRGLKWGKTRRFPKSRWTKDWDHNNDKLLTHRPVARFYDNDTGSKESIGHWVKRTNTGVFSELPRDKAEGTAVDEGIGPGSYMVKPKWDTQTYGGTTKLSHMFQSSNPRDVYRCEGFAQGDRGPTKPRTERFVSTKEERLRLQQELFKCRGKVLGKPAPEDWTKRSNKRCSFPAAPRVTVCDEPVIAAENLVKKYVRIPVRVANGSRPVTTAPAAIVMPTYPDLAGEEDEVMMPTCGPAPSTNSFRAATAAAINFSGVGKSRRPRGVPVAATIRMAPGLLPPGSRTIDDATNATPPSGKALMLSRAMVSHRSVRG